MTKLFAVICTFIVGLATLLFVSFLLSWPVYMLWNGCLLDAVTGVKEITWQQGWGLSVLCSMLFKTTVTE